MTTPTAEGEPAGAPDALPRRLRALLDAQRRAFRGRPGWGPSYAERRQALETLRRGVLGRKEVLARALAEDFGGRAASETYLIELFPLLEEIRHARRHLKEWMAPRPAPVGWQFFPSRARILSQPLGVAGIIGPWNYQLLLTLAPLVGALAAGNHAMIKPSELAPRSAERLRELIADLFPPDYVTVVTGDAGVSAAFSALPFDHLLFTGSTRVGKLVMRAASENLTPVTLELGGKSPVIVHPDSDLPLAATRILTGKLYNAGQTCVAPDYLLIPEQRREEFVALARGVVGALYPRLARNGDYTRIINERHFQRLSGLLEDARARGATVLPLNPGTEAPVPGDRLLPPTLVWGVSDEMALMQEEIFGPILPLVPYRTLDEAIAYVNDRPRPLALYYFDHAPERIERVLQQTICGGVTVNDVMQHLVQSGLPFGGVGPSGMGHYHGVHGFHTFSQQKAVLQQSRLGLPGLFRPPYGPRLKALIQVILRT